MAPQPPHSHEPAFGAAQAASYGTRAARNVPGLDGLHRMTSVLLAERVPPEGRVLVLGAGGGLELKVLAQDHPGWRFDGIDPSADMLDAARRHLGTDGPRVKLHQGYVDSAPPGPFDGAVCLLTLHFVTIEQRLETLLQLRQRLKPGAPLITAHHSYSQTEPERSRWIARQLALSGTPLQTADAAAQAIKDRLTILSPQQDETMLRSAGFSDVTLVFAGLTLRGWVSYA